MRSNALSDSNRSQRWRERRAFWRRPDDLFEPARHSVACLGDKCAKAFVETHHYSGSYPAARLPVGLFEDTTLVGVAVFSVPMGEAVVKRWTGRGLDQACELGRFVLLDRVAANAETWFLRQALEQLRAEKRIAAVVAFSDPLERVSADGATVLPGHVGGIYQASSAVYAGRTRRRRLWLDPAGRVVSERALAKLKAGDKGAAHVYARLRAAGAPAREAFEDEAAYVERALAEGPFRALAHPGNHAYLFACGTPAERRRLRQDWKARHPIQIYPKHATATGA